MTDPGIRSAILAPLALALTALACNLPSLGQPPTATPPTSPLPTQPPSASPTPGDLTSTSAPPLEGPEEAILILEPGPASRLTSPLRVAGIADSTFEQHLLVRLILDDGTELAAGPALIQTELGTRGPFEGELAFSVSTERNALLQVSSHSPRDGGIEHLASVGVTLLPAGPAQILPGTPHPESIQITAPEAGATISGGVAHVEGIGVASFEGTLLIEVYDEQGNLVGSAPVIVDAPEMGLPGSFSADVAYAVTAPGFARISVVDPLPAFDGIGHVASIGVRLIP